MCLRVVTRERWVIISIPHWGKSLTTGGGGEREKTLLFCFSSLLFLFGIICLVLLRSRVGFSFLFPLPFLAFRYTSKIVVSLGGLPGVG